MCDSENVESLDSGAAYTRNTRTVKVLLKSVVGFDSSSSSNDDQADTSPSALASIVSSTSHASPITSSPKRETVHHPSPMRCNSPTPSMTEFGLHEDLYCSDSSAKCDESCRPHPASPVCLSEDTSRSCDRSSSTSPAYFSCDELEYDDESLAERLLRISARIDQTHLRASEELARLLEDVNRSRLNCGGWMASS